MSSSWKCRALLLAALLHGFGTTHAAKTDISGCDTISIACYVNLSACHAAKLPSSYVAQLTCAAFRYTASKLAAQNISDCQYVAAMNPTAGSFQVSVHTPSVLLHMRASSFTRNLALALLVRGHRIVSRSKTNRQSRLWRTDKSPPPTPLLGVCHWHAESYVFAGHFRDVLGRASPAREARQTLSSGRGASVRKSDQGRFECSPRGECLSLFRLHRCGSGKLRGTEGHAVYEA